MRPKQKKLICLNQKKVDVESPPPLPDELITEILSCLPPKSLARFKMVCKFWNTLIFDTFRRRSNSYLLCISCKVPFNVSSLPLKSLLEARPSTTSDEAHLICTLETRYVIIGSCNGLVCLFGTRSYDYTKDYWVCFLNPTTRSMSHKSPNVTFKALVGYDCNYGFGYDHMSDTHKVVLLPDYRRSRDQEIKVFSMGGDNWRDTEIPPPLLRSINYNRVGVYVNGTLNWLATHGEESDDFDYEQGWDTDIIFSFDLNKEEYVGLSLPPVSHTFRYANIGILGECLCVSEDDRENYIFVVWQMKEFGVDESWTKLLNISYGKLQPGMLRFSSRFPLCMFDNGDVLMLHEKLLYNHRDNRLECLEFSKKMTYKSIIYSESLVSPLGIK